MKTPMQLKFPVIEDPDGEKSVLVGKLHVQQGAINAVALLGIGRDGKWKQLTVSENVLKRAKTTTFIESTLPQGTIVEPGEPSPIAGSKLKGPWHFQMRTVPCQETKKRIAVFMMQPTGPATVQIAGVRDDAKVVDQEMPVSEWMKAQMTPPITFVEVEPVDNVVGILRAVD